MLTLIGKRDWDLVDKARAGEPDATDDLRLELLICVVMGRNLTLMEHVATAGRHLEAYIEPPTAEISSVSMMSLENA